MPSGWQRSFLLVTCIVALGLVNVGCARKAMVERSIAEAAAPMPAPRLKASMASDRSASGGPMAPTASEPAVQRMVHHNGTMTLRTTRPRELLDTASRIVTDRGGYVEEMDSRRAVFRIPVNSFDETFRQLLTLGEVLNKSQSTEDITDAFLDADLRLKIATATRQRLIDLLTKAKTEKEKLKIIREIQRITEKIEYLTAQRDRLKTKARYSTITMTVESRQFETAQQSDHDAAAFRWIHRLSPFDRSADFDSEPLPFDVPKEMVALDREALWMAESADGAVIWAYRRRNQPNGDTEFWKQALAFRLAKTFQKSRIFKLGDYQVLAYQGRAETPYAYWIAVRVDKNNRMNLVQVYFPTNQHEKRYSSAIKAVIEKGGK